MEQQSENSLKVLRVKIKNFKNISDLELDLNGKSIFIIGENAQNKTSIMQAIWGALSNKWPKQPIKNGESNANVLVVIGQDGKEYTVEKNFTEKTEKLLITSPEGFTTDKVAKLQELVGDINFDIVKFVNLVNTAEGRREQVKMIRKFLTPEINAEFDAINTNIKNIEENRTELNKNIKRFKVECDANEFSESDYENFKDPIIIDDLLKEQKEAIATNKRIEDAESLLRQKHTSIEDKKRRIKEIMMEQMKVEEEYAALEAELKNAVKVPIEEINKKISDSGNHNSMVEKIKTHRVKVDQLSKAQEMYKKLESDRDELNSKKAELITKSKMPVEGLTFDEDGLFYNGMPLDETQQSTSELMEIGFKIAMARNNPCKIIRVDRAESLGAARLKNMMFLAHKQNYQVFYEEVRRGQEKVMIEYVEE